jgi:hypothetical protein
MNVSLGPRLHRIDRDRIAPLVVGGIWLAGAAFNAISTLRQPDPYTWLEESKVQPYRWFFGEVAGRNPSFWTLALIAGEIALGLLTIAGGKWTRLGLLGGTVFSLLLFSLATPYTMMMGGYAALLAWLAWRERRSDQTKGSAA